MTKLFVKTVKDHWSTNLAHIYKTVCKRCVQPFCTLTLWLDAHHVPFSVRVQIQVLTLSS